MLAKIANVMLLYIGILAITLTQANANTQLGYGLTSCNQYNQVRQQSPAIEPIIDAWVLGYLSGINYIIHTTKGVDLLAEENAENISRFIKGYCSANPRKTVTEATNEYWFNLSEQIGR
jgi:hypothetical protein